METMRFGKFKGMALNEVPHSYLAWCSENLTACPTYITEELGKRGVMTADLWLARAGSHVEPLKPGKRRGKAGRHGRAKAREQTKQNVAAKVAFLIASGQQVPVNLMREHIRLGCGADSNHERLQTDFVRGGGDLTACPFDTDDSTDKSPPLVYGKTGT